MLQISEVRIRLVDELQFNQHLQAFANIRVGQELVIKDLRIILGDGGHFVAMPNRKLTDRCSKCKTTNHLRARFCNHCGTPLKSDRAQRDADGKPKLYADIVHPISPSCREEISATVLRAYQEAVRNQMPFALITFNDQGVFNIQRTSYDQCE